MGAQPPDRKQVLEQLDRILRTGDFERSARISQFLKFIVHKTLDGEAEDIKGYTLGVEVFDKPENFDPDTDATVRVEATRLRKALTIYYHEDGKDDPLIITIPKGSYKPVFIENSPRAPENASNNNDDHVQKFIYFGIATLCLLLLAIGINRAHMPDTVEESVNEQIAPKRYIPVVVIAPFDPIGGPEAENLAHSMERRLTTNLRRFKFLRALRLDTVTEYETFVQKTASLKRTPDTHYAIEGMIRLKDNTVSANIRVLDLEKTTFVWSYEESFPYDEQTVEDDLEELSGSVASQLSSAYGVFFNLEQERIDSNPDTPLSKHYICYLKFYAYSNNKTEQQHKEVRDCLEKAVAEYPEDSNAWAYLAWIYDNEYRYGFNNNGTPENSKQKAFLAAKTAVNTNPQNPRAHQHLAIVAFLNDDFALGKRHGDMAITLNPYDPQILADIAWNSAILGEWEKARELGERAVKLNPGHPRWYHGVLYFYYYNAEDYETALAHALEYFQPDVLLSYVALATSYEGVGDTDKAREISEKLEKKFPEFIQNPKRELESWNFQPEFKQKLLSGIKKAGVDLQDKAL